MPNRQMSIAINRHFENLMDQKVKRLKSLAFWDLHFGPLEGCDVCGAEYTSDCKCGVKWEGFEKATEALGEWAKENIPWRLWYDAGCDYVFESEPEGEKCLNCDGSGTVNDNCECNGSGWIEPYTEETYVLDRKDIKRLIFGKELADYV